MDYQNAIVAIYGDKEGALVSRAAGALKHARSSGICVIHVQVGFRPGFPEISSRNILVSAIKASEQRRAMFEGPYAAIHPSVAPEPSEIVITKHRVGAFAGTDLEMILRAKDIDTLILFGISTSGCVLSTLLDAFDADYRLAVIKDCCTDLDPELHTCLVEKFFPQRASVLSAAEFLAL
jgi:nicotinamidase-related amidase